MCVLGRAGREVGPDNGPGSTGSGVAVWLASWPSNELVLLSAICASKLARGTGLPLWAWINSQLLSSAGSTPFPLGSRVPRSPPHPSMSPSLMSGRQGGARVCVGERMREKLPGAVFALKTPRSPEAASFSLVSPFLTG